VVAENRGRLADAARDILRALRLDPDFTPERFDLTRFFSISERQRDVGRILRGGLACVQAQGELHFSLRSMLTERSRLTDALAEFALHRLDVAPRAEVALPKAQLLARPTARSSMR
jgi:hypothetical protein